MTDRINPALTGWRLKAAADWSAVTWDEMATFLGPGADRFHAVWEKLRAKFLEKGSGIASGWSWPAFLFSFAWFFYRRMWLVGTVLFILTVVAGVLLGNVGGTVGAITVFALYARSYVLQDAVVKIGKVKAKGGDLTAIRAAGGVSRAGGIASGIVGGIIWIIILGSLLLTILVKVADTLAVDAIRHGPVTNGLSGSERESLFPFQE